MRKSKMMALEMNRRRCVPLLLLGLILLLTSLLVGCARPTPPASPTIAFSPSSLSFSAEEGGANPASKTVSISNSGGGTLDWTVTADANWVSLSPTSGASTGESDSVTVSANIYGMEGGDYTATITISGPGASNSPQTVAVVLDIAAPPPKETNTYTNSEYGFSIDYYKDWDVMEDYMGTLVGFFGPLLGEGTYYVNTVIGTQELPEVPHEITHKDYAQMVTLAAKREYAAFDEVEEYDTAISGVLATVVVATAVLEVYGREIAIGCKLACFVKDEVAYTIGYYAPAESYDEYLDAFELAISTFKFE